MNKGYTSPPSTDARPVRVIAALMAAVILFYFCILTGPTGVVALIAVLLVLPWIRRIKRNVYSTVLSAGAAGALVGGAIEGTEDAPSASALGNVLHMFQVIGIRAFFIGLLAAGVGGVLIAAFIRHRKPGSTTARSDARILAEGVGAFAFAAAYAIIALIAIPGFTGVRGKGARSHMESSLRNLAAAQQEHYEANAHFADNVGYLGSYQPDRDVTVVIDAVDAVGWTAHATYSGVTTTCRIKALVAPAGAPPPDELPTCVEARRWF